MEQIIYSIFFLSILGILFGIILAYSSKKFYVKVDEKEKKILNSLPGINCGACGFSGCAGYASALNKGQAPINACIPGGEETIKILSSILGQKTEKIVPKVAEILCKGKMLDDSLSEEPGKQGNARIKFKYTGLKDCKFIEKNYNSIKFCSYGCLECGNCYRVCSFDAIKYNENSFSIPEIIIDKCVGCGACVTECPKNIIVLRPRNRDVHIKCSNYDKPKIAKSICSVSCISCRLCQKKCPVNAITITKNSLAVIDYDKCINCGQCVEVCPVKPEKVIVDYKENRGVAYINDNCKGCSLCSRKCPVNAISGKVKEKFVVDESLCIGCEICKNICKFNAVEIKSPGSSQIL
jgi:Na+-translocating ferredoxin:NAD+ oxidoreductase subunit B